MNFRQGVVIIDHRNHTRTGRSNRQRLWVRPIQWPLASFSQAFWFTLPGLLPLVWFNQDFHNSWEVAGRVFERRDFLLSEGGANRDRKMAGDLQHQAAAQRARLQAACPPFVDGRGADLVGDEIAR